MLAGNSPGRRQRYNFKAAQQQAWERVFPPNPALSTWNVPSDSGGSTCTHTGTAPHSYTHTRTAHARAHTYTHARARAHGASR